MEEIVQSFFNGEIAAAALPIVLQGLLNTILLSLLVVPLGLAGGLVLALLAHSRSRLVRWPLMAWVDFFRAFPPLVLLVLLFAGLPILLVTGYPGSSDAPSEFPVLRKPYRLEQLRQAIAELTRVAVQRDVA